MDMQTRQAMLDKQRQYVEENTCPHLVQCAITEEQIANAVELMRSGIAKDSYLGAAMLSGPCRTQEA